MRSKKDEILIKSTLPRLALLLYAIIPVIESYDWLFCVSMFLIIVLFVLSIIYAIQIYLKNSKEFLVYLAGNKRDNLYELAIAIVGIIISYSMNVVNRSYFWAFVLVLAIIELVWPLNKNK
ncbi:MAG: hypothetical protein EOM31_10400 [Bacteroidia bacterium]|nr:hypothetical protein [Bacteroidia bacterium]